MAGYGDDTAFTAWLADQGYTLPADAPAPAVLRQRGSAYIDGLYGPKFSGHPTDGFDQERAWPRTGAEAHDVAIPSTTIPNAVVQASYFAAVHEANNPGSLQVSATAAGAVKRRKVDVIEVEFFEGSGDASADAGVKISAVEGLLAPFLTVPMPSIFVV